MSPASPHQQVRSSSPTRPPQEKMLQQLRRLRDAGAVVVGRTNMTEFAFSGLGINPHYGTPRNPFDGSMAAFPEAHPQALPSLSPTAWPQQPSEPTRAVRCASPQHCADSPRSNQPRIACHGRAYSRSPKVSIRLAPSRPTVACCARIDAVLSGDPYAPLTSTILRQIYVWEFCKDMGSTIWMPMLHGDFEQQISVLSTVGARLKEVRFPALDEIPRCNANGGIQAFEAYEWHRQLIAAHSELYDPRVLVRILRGKEISQAQCLELTDARRRIISEAQRAFTDIDVWLLPTVPRIAPLISDFVSDDAAYFQANATMLRNTSIVNFLDGCALSIPCHLPGEAPVGLMIAAPRGQDHQLLRIGAAIEAVLAEAGCAIVRTSRA